MSAFRPSYVKQSRSFQQGTSMRLLRSLTYFETTSADAQRISPWHEADPLSAYRPIVRDYAPRYEMYYDIRATDVDFKSMGAYT
jgi:hypothetical protein